MFSSNQIFKISGEMNQLSSALRFALEYSEHLLTPERRERGGILVYQISSENKFCIGWGYESIPDGWNEFPYDFDVDIVSRMIIQHLENIPAPARGYDNDGTIRKGFLMKKPKEKPGGDLYGIKNVFYCIVTFEPWEIYYSK